MKLTRRSLLRGLAGAPVVLGVAATTHATATPRKSPQPVRSSVTKNSDGWHIWRWDLRELQNLQIAQRAPHRQDPTLVLTEATIRPIPFAWKERSPLPAVRDQVVLHDNGTVVFTGLISHIMCDWQGCLVGVILTARDW